MLEQNVSNMLGPQADVDGVKEWDESFGLVYGGPRRLEGNSTEGRRGMLRAPSFPASAGLLWLPYKTSVHKSKFYYPTNYRVTNSRSLFEVAL
jgi:hypothetical protein